jgi:hypothetical protein
MDRFMNNPVIAKINNYFQTHARISCLGQWIVLGSIVALGILPIQYLLSSLQYPYPIIGESSWMVVANALHHGINPYAMTAFPEYMYVYGFLFPFMISLWIGLLEPAFLIPRIINTLALLLAVWMMFDFLRVRKASVLGALVGAMILAYSFCLIINISFFGPDMVGLFIFLLGFYIIIKTGYARRSLFLCALCGASCFYIKQYYLLPFVLLAGYMLVFQSKKVGVLFIGLLTSCILAPALLLRFLAPLYFRYTIIHHLAMVSRNMDHMILQATTFFQWHIVMIALYLLLLGRQLFRRRGALTNKPSLNAFDMERPLLEGIQVDVFDWSLFFMFLVLILSMGQNTGNSLTYFQELLLPFLVIAVVKYIETGIHASIIRNICLIACLLCILPLYNIFKINYAKFAPPYQQVEAELAHCQTIYGAGYTDIFLLAHDQPIYDSGQTKYAYTTILPENIWRRRIVGADDGILENALVTWKKKIGEKIISQEFSCIAVDTLTKTVGDVRLSDYYQPNITILGLTEMDAITYKNSYDAVIWIPKVTH